MQVETTALTFGLFSKLILGGQNPSTELVPPLPLIQHQSFQEIIPPSHNFLEKIPYKEAESSYNSLQLKDSWAFFEQKNSVTTGRVMDILNVKLRELEEKISSGLKETYTTSIDEVDQSTLWQVYTAGNWFFQTLGPLIGPKLIEGKFVTLNDQKNYAQAANFAYRQMGSINQTMLGQRLYVLELKKGGSSWSTPSLQLKVQTEIDLNLTLFQLWQERWNEARKMAELRFYLDQHQFIWQTLLEDNFFQEKEKMKGDEALKKYSFLIGQSTVIDLQNELHASYFNQMASTKQQSGFSKYIEYYLNKGMSKIISLTSTIKEPRNWKTVKEIGEKFTTGLGDQLPLPLTVEDNQLQIFQSYHDAIEKDQFICANWLVQTMLTQANHFNWEGDWKKESQDFENYYRKVSHLLERSEFIYQVIETLNKIQAFIFHALQSELKIQVKEFVFSDFSGSQAKIQDAFLFLRDIEEQRMLMRSGYLKKIQSAFNLMEKTIYERISDSATNKVKRYALKGVILDPTKSYAEVIKENYMPSIEKFKIFIEEYEFYLRSFKNKIDVESYQQTLLCYQEKLNNENYYPVFLDCQELLKFVNNENYSPHSLKIFFYNLNFKTKNSFLSERIVQKFVKQIQHLNQINLQLQNLENTFKTHSISLNSGKGKICVSTKESCEKTIVNVYKSFEKYIITSKNKNQPLTLDRVVGSAYRKTTRILSEGTLFDTEQDYPQLIQSVQTYIKQLNKVTNELISDFEKIKEGTSTPLTENRLLGRKVLEDYMLNK